MANEIVKYHSELNTIPLRKFTPVEMNLFFSIVSRMRDKGDTKVRFSFEQLRELSSYKATANVRFVDDLESTYDKLMDLKFGRRSASGLTRERFVLFTQFKIDGDCEHPYAMIQVHEQAIPLLNNLDEWTRYSLQQFNELQSSYSKTMFRLLKQFRTTGYIYFTKEDLHELLDIPKSYNQGTIDQRVFAPIRQELTAIFKGLTIRKKYGKGRGKPVIGYQFSFKPEIKNANDFNKHAPTKIEQDLALEQANKQLKVDNEKPKYEYSEDELIENLNRKIELLQQAKKLKQVREKEELKEEKVKKETEPFTFNADEKRELLSGLKNLFTE